MAAPHFHSPRRRQPSLEIALVSCLLAVFLAATPAVPVRADEAAEPNGPAEFAHSTPPDVECAVPALADAAGTPPAPPALDDLGIDREQLRAHATGGGVKVAVIDTGVAPHEQFTHVEAGPDFVTPESPNPLWDCDGHGTAVAGIIAARDAGLAPDATIFAVRQTSAHFRNRQGEADQAPGLSPDDEGFAAVGNLGTLAEAIRAAVEAGAHVINISVVSCVPRDVADQLDTGVLDSALGFAEERGAVVVAAAGNAGPGCEPGDAVFPAHSPTVLAVGAIDVPDPHRFADYSLPGAPSPELPTLSAPGEHPVALAAAPTGSATGTIQPQGRGQGRDSVAGFVGTSFAAPVVAGTVALLKQRHPDASAADLRALAVQSAEPHTGYLDPLAAVTARPASYDTAARDKTVEIQPRETPAAPRRVTLLGGLSAGLVFIVLVFIALIPRPRRNR